MKEAEIREEMTVYGKKIVQKGLVVGPGGNISVRHENNMLISPSGYDIADIPPEQWTTVDIKSGEIREGDLRPSSEVLMHLDCYRSSSEINAIVHTHPPYSIALSTITNQLPPLFPDQVALVKNIEFVDYILPTTQDLANAVSSKIIKSPAIMLCNHGLVTVGRNLREAFYRTEVVESSAMIYLLGKSIGSPRVLTSQEVQDIQSLEAEDYRIQLLQNMKS